MSKCCLSWTASFFFLVLCTDLLHCYTDGVEDETLFWLHVQLRSCINIDNITACCSCLTSQPLDREEKRRREKKQQQLSWLKVGQVEKVREVSSRAPDGAGACLGFSPNTQGSTLQHVAPMKATCGPGRRRFTPETRCAPAQVSPFFFFSVLYFPVWQPIFTQFHLTLSAQTVSLPHCLCRKTNTCTVNNEGDGTLSNCLISVFPQYFEYNIYSLYENPPPGHRTSFCIYIFLFCFPAGLE